MKKETFEWIHSWCDYANKGDLPRVLLIGDSITNSYQDLVRKKLAGVCYVDYIACSYSLDNPLLLQLLKAFAKNSTYDMIHFNHGLHGYHIGNKSFERKINKVIDTLAKETKKFTICNCTPVNKEGNKKPHPGWTKRVNARNEILSSIAKEKGYALDDLHSIALTVPASQRTPDGVHFIPEGAETLATKVASFIKDNL